MTTTANAATAAEKNPEFVIQRIYIKDVSFETPNSPDIFQAEWKPEVTMDLGTSTKKIAENTHEVVLKTTIKVKSGEKVAFLIEVEEAGMFVLQNFPQEQLMYMLGSFCPNILFPYAREVISEIVVRGGFPPLYLSPVNFDALYQQHLEKEKEKAK